MKRFLLNVVFGLSLIFVASQTYGQVTVTSSIVTNPPATSCTSTFLTVSGTHNYGGYAYTGATVNIVGTTISVTLNYTFGIGIPTITPFTQSVDIGMIPAGTYTMLTNGTVNGVAYAPYTSSLTVAACCSAVASFTSNQPVYCLGDSIYFTNTSTGSITQQWFNNGSPVSPSINYATVVNSASMDIALVVTNGTCFDTVTQTISGLSAPQITSLSANSDTVCEGELVVLTSASSGAVGANGKIWLNGTGGTAGFGTTLTLFASGTGTQNYTFIATNGACADTDVISIEFLAPPSIDSFDFVSTSVCIGQNVNGNAVTSGANTSTWYIDNTFNSMGNSIVSSPANPGNYDFKLVVSNGYCSDSSQQTITVGALPMLDLGPDTNACSGSVVLDAGSGYTYLWQDGSTNQTFTVSNPGTYYVTVTNSAGCSSTDSVVFSSCLSLNEFETNNFKLGPNPVASIATIQLGSFYSQAEVILFGANGRLYFENHFKDVSDIELDVSALKNGVYFVQVQTESGREMLRLLKE